MATGVYRGIIIELASRINANYTSLGLKSLQIMHKPERLQPDMTPYVQIFPDTNFITENYAGSIQQNRKNADVNLVVWVEYPIENRDSEDSLNDIAYIVDSTPNFVIDNLGIFLTGNAEGFLFWLEKLLDVINTTTTGGLDPQLIASPTRSINIQVNNIQKHEMTISAEINISVQTQPFVINNRQNI